MAGKDQKLLDLALHKAAKHCNVEKFINELEKVSSSTQLEISTIFNQESPSGDSLLHLAVSHGNEDLAAHIASQFPFLIGKKNIKGDTPLHVAARARKLNITKNLVRCGNEYYRGGSKLFLRKTNVNGNTALHVAVMSLDYEILGFLVSADSELIYMRNKEGWSALYMAVKTGDLQTVKPLLEALVIDDSTLKKLEGNSPVHAAIMEKNLDMLEEIVNQKPELVKVRDGKGGTPLHFAAMIGYLPGVQFLLRNCNDTSALQKNLQGSLPIHLASQSGHIKVIQDLLQKWPDPKELINREGQNILHVAAKCGRNKVVKFILKTSSLESLINEKDRNGNTPLHLAAMNWHPMVVTSLTWDSRVDVKLVNNSCLTALDVALQNTKGQRMFREKKTIQVLKSAGSSRSLDSKIFKQQGQVVPKNFEPLQMEWIKDRINTLLLVETLMVTVTFTAGFTLPGGYNGCDCPDKGIATLLRKGMLQAFVIFDTLSFYSSVIALVTLMWAQLGDAYLALTAYTLSKHLFGVSLALMSLAFMVAISIAISKLTWLFVLVLTLGTISLIIFMMHFIALIFPHGSTARFMRYISYYINLVLIPASGNSMRFPVKNNNTNNSNR